MINNTIRVLLALILFLFGFICLATTTNKQNRYFFHSIEVENGLAQNSVYSIFQDDKGFMWFGTQDGLNRYDGNEFKIFKRKAVDDHSSIVSNVVISIMQNTDGIIWLGTTDGVALYNPLSETFSRLDAKTPEGETVEGIIRDIKRDKSGNIWIASSENGLYSISAEGELRVLPLKGKYEAKPVGVWDIEFEKDENLWVATQFGVYCVDPASGAHKQYLVGNDPTVETDNMITDMLLLDAETLLVGTANRGLQGFSLSNKTFFPLMETDEEGNPLYVRSILKSRNSELWIGTEKGVYIYNVRTRNIINLRHINNDPYSLSDNAIHSLFQDREGGMWIGTFFGGVNYFIDSYSYFQKFYPVKGENSISGKSISEFCEDRHGYIWIGTEDAGLNRFNPSTRSFTSGFIPASNIHALMAEGNDLWVGTFANGLYVMNIATGKYKAYKSSAHKNSLNNNSIYSLYKDQEGTIWVGSMSGLHTYDSIKDCFIRIKESVITHQVNDILEDYKGRLWFATMGNGLFTFDRTGGNWKHYPSVLDNGNVAGRMITCILYDSRNRLWIGTEGAGICMYDAENDTFDNFHTTMEGLPNDVIYQLVEDERGNLWGSTNKGLFVIERNKVSVYNHANGLLGDQFNYKSGFLAGSGELYFGGIRGFVSFQPQELEINRMAPPVAITNFYLYGNMSDDNRRLSQNRSITHAGEINIPSKASTFSLGVAALSYVSPSGNKYAFQLVGRDPDWIFTDGAHYITYSELPPGRYIFRAKASNADGVWNEEGESLVINVLPPYYGTIWAKLVYAIIICSLLYYTVRRYSQRIRIQNKRALETLEREKEKELYNAKILFFTNITHEIRTPLSLIKSPLEDVLKRTECDNQNWENLKIIERNANRLLTLVNQLLDFRNVQSKGVTLDFISVDIIPLILEITDGFGPTAKMKGLVLETDLPCDSFFMDAHPDTVTKILSNLLSNALKHAKTKIRVTLTAGVKTICIAVSNDGEAIPKEYSKKIFEPFFKLSDKIQGSGIGLPLMQSLVQIHHGECFLAEDDNINTTFIIRLPVYQQKSIRLGNNGGDNTPLPAGAHAGMKDIDEVVQQGHKKRVMIVEDNEEFLRFTANQLKDNYHVLKASNGLVALETLETEHVDLIISDIMMPLMDGMELCRKIKENIMYSHVPVILLTAKTSLQSKIDGMKIGADEYIVKPYSIDYLKARIENLMESRKMIRESYRESPELAYNTIACSKADEEFLKKLVDNIYSDIGEADLDVDKLAEKMHMSRATFYRKVKSISELTPNDFIRILRLKKAAELLRQKEYKVNEIAFIVGFSSPSYFSRCFYKQFGILPKDF